MSRNVRRLSGTIKEDDETLAERAVQSITDQSGFSYARVLANDLRTSHVLQRCGFYIVENSITLEHNRLSEIQVGGRARFAREDDKAAVEEIARRSIRCSRFHMDPEIPARVAEEIKAQWVGNYFRGQRGDYMVVAERAGEVASFAQLLKAPLEVLIIDLIAVAERHRGHGLAEEMIRFAATNCGPPLALRAGTQGVNITSLGMYQKIGFRIVSTGYVFHHHKHSD
jgi:GNAT superfamily N-acetyltransferase